MEEAGTSEEDDTGSQDSNTPTDHGHLARNCLIKNINIIMKFLMGIKPLSHCVHCLTVYYSSLYLDYLNQFGHEFIQEIRFRRVSGNSAIQLCYKFNIGMQ